MGMFEDLKEKIKERAELVEGALDVFEGHGNHENNKDISISNQSEKKNEFCPGRKVDIMRSSGEIEQ